MKKSLWVMGYSAMYVKDDNIVDGVLDKMVETFGVKLNKWNGEISPNPLYSFPSVTQCPS